MRHNALPERARDYLRSRGIPDYVIFVDNDGGSSRRTVDNVLAMREKLRFNSLIVVTQYFHVARCKMLFRHRGFRNVSSVAPEYFEWRDFRSVPREFFLFYAEL
ncbi:MAG: YdcF family protein [Rikenellaceae bacterium]|jgi:uncharacterized SAM-binding protein YcdF (DUF218 family)|nr:YdcF family protein [Rikenellaceae bacterium]